VAKPGNKVKNALDEARILVLGTQVLLGFQYRAFFEKGWEALPPADRRCELGALFALLLTVGALFLPAARHRLVEQGNDSGRFLRFTMLVVRFALAPFGIALTLDVGVAGDRIFGPWCGAACAAGTAVSALAFWYGHFARSDRKPLAHPEETMERTPLEHRIIEVLTEARVVLPGAQALLGFQLAMVLMEPFAQLPKEAKLAHLFSLACVALATIVLMAPAAYHRIVEGGEDTERFHAFASKMVLLALTLLAPGFAGDLYVVLVRAEVPGAGLIAAAAWAIFYAAWFGAMLLIRRRAPTLRQRGA
jgi:hypothetical protein